MIQGALVGLALLVLVATVLPFSRSERWWVRGWDFPRLQIACLALGLAVAAGWALDLSRPVPQAVLAVSAACALYQAARVFPYTRLARTQVRRARPGGPLDRLRLLSANVLIENRAPHRLLSLVRAHRPDILVTLETDAWWERHLDTLLPEYPHTIKRPLANSYGMHVYSRLPLEEPTVEFLIEREVPSMHATVVLRSGQRVRAHFLHPTPPSPTENPRSTERDAELIVVAKRVAQERGPVIVTGDLNDVAWSTTTRLFCKLSRLLDPRIGRGMFNTFHARWPCLRWPLDHIFHSDDFTLVALCRLPAIGSDHFPILAELAFQPERAAEQEAPRAGEADRELAREKLAHAGAGR
jgi:endonuclease/exonuclease/phosphatase (EEP) superfamily protein YafD